MSVLCTLTLDVHQHSFCKGLHLSIHCCSQKVSAMPGLWFPLLPHPHPPAHAYTQCLQDDKFSAQVASLEAEVKSLKAEGANLAKDNKACYTQIRAKDKQLDAAAKEVDHARQTELHNKVRAPFRLLP